MLYFFRLIATAEIYTLSLHDALPIWDVHPLGEEHLHADEGQHQAQAVVQEVELVHQAVQHEVEGAQAEHGEDVRREDDERVVGDAEDGWDRVDGEDDVGGLDDEQHDEQRRRPQLAVLADEELLPLVSVDDAQAALQEADRRVLLRLHLHLAVAQDLDSGVDQEDAEEVEDPPELGDERHAEDDEQPAQQDGAEDAPEQHTVAVLGGRPEVLEDDDEDE